MLHVGGVRYVVHASNALPCRDPSSPAPAYRDATSCLPNSSLLTAPRCAPQLRQRVGEDAGAKGSSSKSGGSKSGSSKGAAEEEDSGYQDAQDALEEMIEEVGDSGNCLLGLRRGWIWPRDQHEGGAERALARHPVSPCTLPLLTCGWMCANPTHP